MNDEIRSQSATRVTRVNPRTAPAIQMSNALWTEIQRRYGFSAPDPFDPEIFVGLRAGFWVAFDGDEPVGSVALTPLSEERAELDVMYGAPTHRRRGLAEALLAALEAHARITETKEIVLRAGGPQPEALAFYRAAGFQPTPCFGRWTQDDTAVCFRKTLN